NMYGITETTVHVTHRPIALADLDSGARIGPPIGDLQLYVLDTYQQPVPDGITGELYVAGAGLSRGYLGRPALTAQRMIANPFGPGRLYRTGDLGRRRGDDLEYRGRADDQVKVRGFRIELGEIEIALAQHPHVSEAVVLLKNFGGDEKRLAAYVVTREPLSANDLRAFLGARVPDYMIPAPFVFLDAMPLTANGKINRAMLPLPSLTSDAYIAPRTDAERLLAELWSEVLGVERPGIHDNFFAHGGDSIRSIQIVSRARARGFDTTIHDLFEHPTIAALAAAKQTDAAAHEERTAPFALVSDETRALLPDDVEDAYPLTMLQQGMFFYSGFEAGATTYHDVMSYHLRAAYDRAALVRALAAVSARHPMLRTSFDFDHYAEPLQLVHRHAVIPFGETDLREIAAPDDAIAAWIEHERQQPFAPEAAPLLRVHVHRRSDETFQFSVSFHHAILDGWSLASLLTEVFREMRALPVAAAPELTFRDFVALERRTLETDDARAFWAPFLADAPFNELPRLQSNEMPRAVRQQPLDISDDVSRAVKTLADDAGVPLRSVLLAAHVRALAHITGQRDVVTGLVTNGRPEAEGGERVLGLFLNTIPFRARLGGGSWLELVRETFRTEQQLHPHRRVPLSEIQKAAGGKPLFETDFNFVHFHVFEQTAGIEGFESLGASGFEETNFTLAVNFSWWGNPGRLGGALDYDASLLTEEQARTYARIYAEILATMSSRRDDRYDTHPLSSQPLDFVRADIPPLALHELIAPPSTAVAVRSDRGTLTYEELHRRANQLANALRRNGVGPDVVVGVALQPGLDRVVALLGILKAGGAYLPLDPDYPRQRLAFMLEDSAVAHLVTRDGVLPFAPSANVIDVDQPHESVDAPPVSVSPENVAYALYTSGSTGRPKGVLITHRGIVNHMLWMQREYPLATHDAVLQKTPFSFDAAVWEFWAPLIAGASLFTTSAGGQQDPAYLIDTIRTQQITIVQAVPTLLDALLAEETFASCTSLRRVFVGGEAVPLSLVQRCHAKLPNAALVNLYGPTETTIEATSHRFTRDADDRFVRIGRAIANARTYVLDRDLQFVPAGTDGDLYIAGAGLGRGYLNRAALTAASFIADPYGEPGARMYRTGDRARRLADGTLEFRGRADRQLKLRGFRVEPAEIEAALASHPAIAQAIVDSIDERLVAYVIAPDGFDSAALREHLRGTLPEHMLPTAFIALERLPLTPSGKLDRNALPRPDARATAAHREYAPPTSAAEQAIAAAWEAILGIAQIGIDDNFFELGGDSIVSLRIVARVRQSGWVITPKLILQQQTVARVAAHAERIATRTGGTAIAAGELALSSIQQQFFEQQLPNPHHWNQSVLLAVPRSFSLDAFRAALDAVARAHDALRLRFTRGERGWQQAYRAGVATIPLELSSDVARVQASLDITHGPLMRAAYFEGSDGDGRLLLVAHHLIVDAVSWRILFEDLAAAYAQALRNAAIRLPERTASLRSWIEHLQAHAAVADPRPWLALASHGVTPLPAERVANREADARSIVMQLDADETRALIHDLPKRTRANVTEALMTALTETITQWTGGDTLWLDLEGHGREDLFDGVDVSRTMGWFTSLFPVAIARSNSARGGALLQSVKTQLRAVPNKGLDFGVLRHLSPDASLRAQLAALPPREISFNYLGRFEQEDGPFRAAPESTGPDHDPNGARQYLLDVIARVVEGRLAVEWSYAGLAFDAATIETLAATFARNVRELLATDAVAYAAADFPLARLEQSALDALLAGRNDVEDLLPLSPLQEGLLFHALDEERPGVYLQQIAVVLEGHIDRDAFARAWNRAIERHPVLRTSFHRRELQRPLQLVHQRATCSIAWLDWRTRSVAEQTAAWQQLLEDDRRAGVDLQQPPLMRLTAIREDDTHWRVLWTHHHLILDGWSLPIVMQDVVAFYREEREGEIARLREPLPYAAFIAALERRDHHAAGAYWREALRGFEQPNELALAPPTVAPTSPYAEAELVVEEELTARLGELAQSSRVTLNSVLQALWALLLGTYSRQSDVVFGVTVSGRPADLPGIDQTAGLFINTLPLRVDVAPGASVRALLQDVQQRQAAMSQFEFSRLVDVQQCSSVPRGRALFESIFVFENYPLGESLADAPLRDFSVQHAESVEWTHYPLTCFVTPGRVLRVKLLYQTARFDARAIARILEQARTLLELFVTTPAARLGNLVSRPHAPSLLTGAVEAEQPLFHDCFTAQAARTPDAVALMFEEQSLTYRELDQRSNQLARHLQRRGLQQEQLVGLFLDRGPEMLVALLAVLKAGGAYLPLDPRFPTERLAMMIEDGAPAILLTQAHLAERVPPHRAQLLRLDADWPLVEGDSPAALQAEVDREQLAYVIFTSGSTGRPKGVQISHRALA
ncbi:MAG TPA: amino acid adenylation domain-containing protein, partial [Thermoanaerobaculia bacterium]